MGRSKRKRRIGARRSVIAFVVDGETEMWYLQMLKKNEEREGNIQINIKPEIPQKKKLKDQYELVCNLSKEHKQVFWILDFDVILKETRDHSKDRVNPLNEFLDYSGKLQAEYENVRIVVNNPCFEYWFLLHYVKTQKKFANCSGVIKELKKQLPGYDKTEKYFKAGSKDIYARLKPNLKEAIANTSAFGGFDVDNPRRAMCEMNELFMIEELRNCRE